MVVPAAAEGSGRAASRITSVRSFARVVGVAQLVELRVVVAAVAGSNPVAHPFIWQALAVQRAPAIADGIFSVPAARSNSGLPRPVSSSSTRR